MSTLNDFVASIQTEGLMHTNRFSVDMNVPPILAGNDIYVGDLQKILLHCDSVTLPGLNVSTTQARTFGEIREMPYEKLYDNVTINFYVDNTMQVKLLFDTWINNSIQDLYTRKFNYYKQYTSDMMINVFDKNENQRYVVRLFECYPKSVSAIQMDYSSKDVMRLQVSMNYKYWDSNIMDASVVSDPTGQSNVYNGFNEVPNNYFTDFNAYQTGFNSFENSRTSLFASEPQNISTGLGSIFN